MEEAFTGWHEFSYAILKYTNLLIEHTKNCGGELVLWVHGTAGYVQYRCKECGLVGSLSVVRFTELQPVKVPDMPTLHLIWLKEKV